MASELYEQIDLKAQKTKTTTTTTKNTQKNLGRKSWLKIKTLKKMERRGKGRRGEDKQARNILIPQFHNYLLQQPEIHCASLSQLHCTAIDENAQRPSFQTSSAQCKQDMVRFCPSLIIRIRKLS